MGGLCFVLGAGANRRRGTLFPARVDLGLRGRAHFCFWGSSAGLRYVMSNGPSPLICTTVGFLAYA